MTTNCEACGQHPATKNCVWIKNRARFICAPCYEYARPTRGRPRAGMEPPSCEDCGATRKNDAHFSRRNARRTPLCGNCKKRQNETLGLLDRTQPQRATFGLLDVEVPPLKRRTQTPTNLIKIRIDLGNGPKNKFVPTTSLKYHPRGKIL